MKRLITIITVAALASCGGAETGAGNGDRASTRFELAYEICEVPSLDGVATLDHAIEVADEGTSLIMDGPPDGSKGLDAFLTDVSCILAALDVPDFVIHNMDNTTSLMGLQEAEWDGIHAQWSYHPDNGLDVVLTEIA
ncbi:MAG: hypothetical protein ACT4PO_12390 [Actinomycetota bacterium]